MLRSCGGCWRYCIGRDEGLNASIRYHRLRDIRCAAKVMEMYYYFKPLQAVTECKRDEIKVHPRRLVAGV